MNINKNTDAAKEIAKLVTGWLGAAAGVLATLNIKYEWLTPESINAFGLFLIATVMLVTTVYGVYKNSYVMTKKAKMQSNVLKQRGLK